MNKHNQTVTIPKEIKQKIKQIQQDNIHGASYLAQQSAEIYSQLIQQINSYQFTTQRKLLMQTAKNIIHAQPAMASIFTLTNNVLLNSEKATNSENLIKNIQSTYTTFLHQQTKTSTQLVKHVLNIIPDNSTILTYSYSSTIYNALVAAKNNGKKIIVICPESRPLNEGATLAQHLSKKNIQTTLIVDSAIFSQIPQIDLILVGADAVTSTGIINKIGTNGIALAAQFHQKPFYPLITTDKLLPQDYMPCLEIEKNSAEIHLKQSNIQILNYYFDFTPYTLFSQMITENGIQKISQIQNKINTIVLHPHLKNLSHY